MRRRSITSQLVTVVALAGALVAIAPEIASAKLPTTACDATNPFVHVCGEFTPAPAAHDGDVVELWVTLCNESDVQFMTTIRTTVRNPLGGVFWTKRVHSFLVA